MAESTNTERHDFQAEVNRILDIVVNSLYAKRDVFLRELISNASDACDKLRYEAQLDNTLLGDDPDLGVTIELDDKNRIVRITDNGIGMSRDELVENLGTIAGSGTAKFVERLESANSKENPDVSLIGQFGVGFYSAFMVASEVAVTSRRAGSDEAWRWRSNGRDDFVVEPVEGDAARGTHIEITLKKDAKEYADVANVETIVRNYSGHIGIPVWISEDGASRQVNEAAALWTRSPSSVTADEYTEFYRHVGHAFDAPWHTIHKQVEGRISYSALLFIPSMAPFDLFDPKRKHSVKLYVRRVFITGECEGLLPSWLRFVKGVVDSEDLPLNVSREVLQSNPVVARMSKTLVKWVIGELSKKAKKEHESYVEFWETYGAVIKEGIYQDEERRADLLKLARFKSTASDGWVGLDEYLERMKDGQESIYVLTGDKIENIRSNPMLEAFKAKNVEVLLLDQPVDEFWLMVANSYADKSIADVGSGEIDLSAIGSDAESRSDIDVEKDETQNTTPLVAMLKLALESEVKDVRESSRLTESACCLVVDEGDLSMGLRKIMRANGQDPGTGDRILEINPRHALIRTLASRAESDGSSRDIEEMAHLLLDQALILEGELPSDAAGFVRRMSDTMARAVS